MGRYDPDTNPYAALTRDRFGYQFSGDERMEPLEDHLIGRVILWDQARQRLDRTIRRTREDLGYLVTSLEDANRTKPYIPIGGFDARYPHEAGVIDDLAHEIEALVARLHETIELIHAGDELVASAAFAQALTAYVNDPGAINKHLRAPADEIGHVFTDDGFMSSSARDSAPPELGPCVVLDALTEADDT